ncbi:MAG: phage tail assembly chaperone [Lachnospiraceae bacterium]|nr:phage tail assembly chaperone [Lachnospiraceae bacterium]
MTKMLYEYSPQTGELIAANPATPDPKHPGQYLARMNTTFTAPPATGEHEAAVWKNGQWETTPDWRGTTYYLRNENNQIQQVEIKELGKTVPEGAYLNRDDVPETEKEKASAIRAERNVRIAEADIAINKAEDTGLDTAALRVYRQALRDVPQQSGFPESVNWPVNPAS